MSAPDFDPVRLFNSLNTPPDRASEFVAVRLPFREMDFIAKNHNGEPAVLIAVEKASDAIGQPPITLEHLLVDHGVQCRIQQQDGTSHEGVFSVIRCINADTQLQEYFFRSLVPVVNSLPRHPSRDDISRMISLLVDLFYRLIQPSRKSIQGIWGELFLIVYARNPIVLVKAWHPSPNDRYDFALGRERVEVKSTSGGVRIHHFSFEQLHPPSDLKILIASVYVEESDNGQSIFDLVDVIHHKIKNDSNLAIRVDQIVGVALGNSWRRASEMRFDLKRATSSLMFYNPSSIPSVPCPLPVGVNQVHFQSDMSLGVPIDLASINDRGVLFAALDARELKYEYSSER